MASSIVGAVLRMKDMKLSRRDLISIDVFDWPGDVSALWDGYQLRKHPGMAWVPQSVVVTGDNMRKSADRSSVMVFLATSVLGQRANLPS
jgi:hypothetical protein